MWFHDSLMHDVLCEKAFDATAVQVHGKRPAHMHGCQSCQHMLCCIALRASLDVVVCSHEVVWPCADVLVCTVDAAISYRSHASKGDSAGCCTLMC